VIKRRVAGKGKASMSDKKRVMERKNAHIKDIKSVDYINNLLLYYI
jgi:hypothetical protein